MLEKTISKPEKKMVKIQWCGDGPWTLAYKGRPSKTIYPNKFVELSLTDWQDLYHIIEVIKIMNSHSNELTRVTVSPHGKQHEELYRKWSFVEGEKLIPERIRKITYDVNGYYDEEMTEMIEALAPEFFTKRTPEDRKQRR